MYCGSKNVDRCYCKNELFFFFFYKRLLISKLFFTSTFMLYNPSVSYDFYFNFINNEKKNQTVICNCLFLGKIRERKLIIVLEIFYYPIFAFVHRLPSMRSACAQVRSLLMHRDVMLYSFALFAPLRFRLPFTLRSSCAQSAFSMRSATIHRSITFRYFQSLIHDK